MTESVQYRKPRRDAKLLHLPEETCLLIQEWLKGGVDSCLERIKNELGISTSQSVLYRAITRWTVQALFDEFNSVAAAQVAMEEAAFGKLSADQREEAIDRHFIVLAHSKKDTKLYQQMRYLRIADQKAKSAKRVAQAKLEHGTKALRQKDKALRLVERKLVMMEKKIQQAKRATENKTLSAEERARRVREILQ
jgi:hypothetical protein